MWLANTRGNLFSRRHRRLDPGLEEEFWDFTFEDVGRYDTKAVIDFILKHTKTDKLDYIGHSMGCTVLLMAMSEDPQWYNKRLNHFIALGPATLLAHLPRTILTKGSDNQIWQDLNQM